jgi:hypothetical protein
MVVGPVYVARMRFAGTPVLPGCGYPHAASCAQQFVSNGPGGGVVVGVGLGVGLGLGEADGEADGAGGEVDVLGDGDGVPAVSDAISFC